jgi:hypothetical protein
MSEGSAVTNDAAVKEQVGKELISREQLVTDGGKAISLLCRKA